MFCLYHHRKFALLSEYLQKQLELDLLIAFIRLSYDKLVDFDYTLKLIGIFTAGHVTFYSK